MDTSAEYIKMCEKAVEVQKLWYPIEGDVSKWKTGAYIVNEEDLDEVLHELKREAFWLPRQDQLQGMAKTGNTTATELHHKLDLSIKGSEYFMYTLDWSMEQLWLAFVMREKYGKIWDGEKWI